MESINYITTVPLDAGQFFPLNGVITAWDDVLDYTQFFVQILGSTRCRLVVYQSTPTNPAATEGDLTLTTATVYNYFNVSNSSIISGSLNCRFIAFTIQNGTNTDQTNLSFSVIYK
jgi:hypothetical protein